MRESTQADASQKSSVKDWGYALVLLAAISGFFLTLRLIGRPFIVAEFEVLIVHLPAVVCLLAYVKMVLSVR